MADAMTRAHHVTLLCLAVVALVLLAVGSKRSPGSSAKVEAATTEGLPKYTFQPPAHYPVVGVDDLSYGYVWTPHRYPRITGGEITAVIHHGFHIMSLPQEGDMLWLSAPPSEEML